MLGTIEQSEVAIVRQNPGRDPLPLENARAVLQQASGEGRLLTLTFELSEGERASAEAAYPDERFLRSIGERLSAADALLPVFMAHGLSSRPGTRAGTGRH